jgi:general secretion pathway protein D
MVLSERPSDAPKGPQNADFQGVFGAQPGIGEGRAEHGGRNLREQDARMSSRSIGRLSRTTFNRFGMMFAAAALVFCCAAPCARAQSAGSWNKRGLQAEQREDFDAAYEAFRQAHLKKPSDARYRTRYERLRFQAANQHVDRGRVLRQSGDIGGAVNEFARALQIDPGNQAAAQELQLTDRPASGSGGAAANPAGSGVISGPAQALNASGVRPPGVTEQTPQQMQTQREINAIGSPVTLQAVSTEPITLHMVEDVKVIYQAIGKAAGLNVLFDPDYASKRIPVDLTSVSLADALRIVGTISGTFFKPVTSNTIFVAQNNRQKRGDFEDLAVQTFYLTNASQQNDANDILVALRNLLDPSIKVFLVASQNAIVLRATSDQLILAEKLINDLDRTRPEVVVDVAVLEVSRDKIRNLGITLPTSFGLTPQGSTASTNSTSSSTSTGTTANSNSTTSSTNLSLNTLGNLNATNFAVSLSGGTVNALLSDSDTRILQNPRIRATDGQRATLKIGSKIPVATGSYNAGVATGAASIGVQTQFTYLDVGVNIDMTPTVHYDREVSLKMKIEVSAQNGSQTISGVEEPIISQRVAEQVIQLRDGEPSLLAGLMEQQDTKSVGGTPGLGEIPLLKYFFSSQKKESLSDEIVFLLIPHIVRESVVTDQNMRPIYTGPSNSIELIHNAEPVVAAAPAGASLRGMSPPVPEQATTAANAASAMLPAMAAAARPAQRNAMGTTPGPASGTTAAGAASAMAAGSVAPPVNLSIIPAATTQSVGSAFQVAVLMTNARDVFSVPLQVHFDQKVLQLVSVDAGDVLGRDGQAVALVHRDEGNGNVTISASRPPNVKGVDGQGTLCTLTFKALTAGSSNLALVKIGAKDSKGTNLPAVGSQATVQVK